jgi:hypothetical protein
MAGAELQNPPNGLLQTSTRNCLSKGNGHMLSIKPSAGLRGKAENFASDKDPNHTSDNMVNRDTKLVC